MITPFICRGRGTRERILSASQQLFRDQGIHCTGMDQLSAVSVEIQNPDHPARVLASDYKKACAARLTEAARASLRN